MKLIVLFIVVSLVCLLVFIVKRRKYSKPAANASQDPEIYAIGFEHYKAGRLQEAEASFREAIRIKPDFAEAHYRLGNLLTDRQLVNEAEEAYRQALRLKPDYPQAYNNLGNLLRYTGRHGEAEAAFRSAIGIKADFPEALNNLGILMIEAGQLQDAEDAFRQVLRISPDSYDVLHNLALLLEDLGRLDEAEAGYRQVLSLNREFYPAHNALGVLLSKNGRSQEAETYFRDALKLNPGEIEIQNNLGLALLQCGRLEEAEGIFRQALALQPNHADTLTSLADLLVETDQWVDAEATYRLALKANPGHVAALDNLANLMRRTHRIGEAESLYRTVLGLQPDRFEIINNLGSLLMVEGRFQEAKAAYLQAERLGPKHSRILLNIAMLQMLEGDFEQGWQGMEHRLLADQKQGQAVLSKPRWDGKEFIGKTLLVQHEQGAGDNIQFIRYLPMLAAMGGRVIVECPEPLIRLFRASLPEDIQLIWHQGELPEFDFYCPLMSLPMHFKTQLDTILAQVPYLKPPSEAVANCPVMMAKPCAPIKIGLVWAGNPKFQNDNTRSLDFSVLEPLLNTAGVTWAILQMERRPEGFDLLAERHGYWLDPMASVKDFADTAAVIEQLDMVIGVDTAVVHLAGALGKPAWLLLQLAPDWRWLLHREDSPWYPGIRLFRQTAYNDWPGVIQRVAEALPAQCDALLQAKQHNDL